VTTMRSAGTPPVRRVPARPGLRAALRSPLRRRRVAARSC
jgi:hypothetical protein